MNHIHNDIERLDIEDKIRHCRHILREQTKSSVIHFAKYFPMDAKLSYWKDLIMG